MDALQEQYLAWYGRCVSRKGRTPDFIRSIIADVYLKQEGKCAITGTDLTFEKFRPNSVYLRINDRKKWLPDYELVCWVFRELPQPKPKYIEQPIEKTIKRVYYDDEDDYGNNSNEYASEYSDDYDDYY